MLDECDKCLDKVDMRKEFPLGWDVEARGSLRAIYAEHFCWGKDLRRNRKKKQDFDEFGKETRENMNVNLCAFDSNGSCVLMPFFPWLIECHAKVGKEFKLVENHYLQVLCLSKRYDLNVE